MRRPYRIGLVVLAVLSVFDLLGPLFTDGDHPPMSVALAGAAVGLVSLALILPAWRGSRPALWSLVALRVLSALTAVPAFVVSGVPAAAVAAALALVVLTVAGVVLVVVRRPALVGTR